MGNTTATTCPWNRLFLEKLILASDNWQSVYAKFYCDVREQWRITTRKLFL